MKKRLFLIATALSALLTLCACDHESPSQGDGLRIYRVSSSADYARQSGDRGLFRVSPVTAANGESELAAMLKALSAMPVDGDAVPVLPDGVTIISCKQLGREAIITLSDEYVSLPEFKKTLVNACLTLSLCTVRGIETVSVYAPDGAQCLGLTADDMLLFDTETNPYERSIRLYFLSGAGRYLTAEYRTLSVGRNAYLERYTIEELLRGPGGVDMSPAVPEGTALLGISTENGLCSVDLSAQFSENLPKTLNAQRLAVLSVVNSLTSISGVSEVLILVDGEPLTSYGEYAPGWPMQRNDTAIGPANLAKGETDVNICVYGANNAIISLPRIISPDERSSPEEAVTALMLSGEAEPGFSPVFPYGGSYLSIETSGDICVVNFPGGFFEKYTRNRELSLCMAALKNALYDTSGVKTLRVLRDGVFYMSY